MNKRKDILDEISYKYLYQQDKASEMFLRMLWEYYAKNDLETESLLGSLFYTLYMIPEKLSYDEIV